MEKHVVIHSNEVKPFVVNETYSSKMLVDKFNTLSKGLQINEGTLKAGCKLHGHTHRPPFDEIYYVVRGEAYLNMNDTKYDLHAGSLVFIPGGTFHALENKSETEDFVVMTIWPNHPDPGVNPVYDKRVEAWGSSYQTIDPE